MIFLNTGITTCNFWRVVNHKNIETQVKERLNTFQIDCIIYLLIVEYLDTNYKDLDISTKSGEKDYQLNNVLLCAKTGRA